MSDNDKNIDQKENPEKEKEKQVLYRIGGVEVTESQLWSYREIEAAFWGAVDAFMLAQTKILFSNLDKDDIKMRRMLARQAVGIMIVMDDGAMHHATRTVHTYTGGHVGIQTEHADPHMTPLMTGPTVRKIEDEAEAD